MRPIQWCRKVTGMKLKGVAFEQVGDWDFKFTFDHVALKDIFIEFSKVPEDKRARVARQFLSASLTWCTTVWLYSLLSARGVNIKDITSNALVQMGKDEADKTIVEAINLDIVVDVPEENIEAFERCRSIVEKGCLIGNSLERGITVNHSISLKHKV
jgi:uncharacterized OsmC-like protein